MATSLASFAHNVYMGSLSNLAPSAPRLAKIQHGILSCFGLPSFNMAAQNAFSRR